MFKSLREKLTSWFKKPEEKEEEKAKEKAKSEEKKGKKKDLRGELEELEQEILETQKEKIIKIAPEESEQIIEQAPLAIKEEEKSEEKKGKKKKELEVKVEEKIREKKSKGFLKKIFSKKEKKEQIEEIKPEVKIEAPELEEKTKQILEEKIEEKEKIPLAAPSIPRETIQEPVQKEGFFAKLTAKLSTSTLKQDQFDELFQELETILLENNVALEVAEKIHDELSKDLVGIEIKKSKIESTVINSLKDTILNLLIEPPDLLQQIKKKEGIFTIIFVGINGSGKTTSIAKLADFLKQNKISSVLAAADTFRAASIEQLEKHAEKLDIPIIRQQYGADPAAVAFDAKKYAEAHKIKAVLIDTAGRMYTKSNLIKEMEKIVKVSKPDLKIFVGESITGNDATEQAKTFNEAINIDGIILSKADVDEKAGTILSVSYVIKKPIYFLGTGQKYPDLIPFTKKTILKNLGLE